MSDNNLFLHFENLERENTSPILVATPNLWYIIGNLYLQEK